MAPIIEADTDAADDAAKKAERAKRFGIVAPVTKDDVAEAKAKRAKRFGAGADVKPNDAKGNKGAADNTAASKGKGKENGKANQRARAPTEHGSKGQEGGKAEGKGKGGGKHEGKGKGKGKPREPSVQDYTDHVIRFAGGDAKLQNRLRGWVRDKIMGLQAAGSLNSTKWDTEPLPTTAELQKLGWVEATAQASNGSAKGSAKGEQRQGRGPPPGAHERAWDASSSQGRAASASSSWVAPPQWQHAPPPYGHPGYGYPPAYGHPGYGYPPAYGAPVYPDYQQHPPQQQQHQQQIPPAALPPQGQLALPAPAGPQGTPTKNPGVRLRSRSPLGRAPPPPPSEGFRVRLINVPPELTAMDFVEALQDACKQRIESVDILRNTTTGKPTGETLVVFSTREDALTVVNRYHKGDLNGRTLEVVLEEPAHYSYRAAVIA